MAADGLDEPRRAHAPQATVAQADAGAADAAREARRLAALRRVGILDTPPEEPYDDLARLAGFACGTATALLSFIDADRQWMKARVGFDASEIARSRSICTHAIRDAMHTTVVEDLAAPGGPFASHALVVDAPHFRFYAGAPIVVDGDRAIGTVAVLDTRPRAFGDAERHALEALARQVATLLALRAPPAADGDATPPIEARIEAPIEAPTEARIASLQRDSERLSLAIAGGDVGLWDWQVRTGAVTRNAQWSALFGYEPEETAGSHDGLWRELVHRKDALRSAAVMERHLAGETAMFECEVRMRHRDGHWMWVLDRAKVVQRDAAGAAVRVAGLTLNVSDRKAGELALHRTSDVLEHVGRLARVGGWEIDARTATLRWTDETYRIHEVEPGTPPTLDLAIRFYPPEVRSTVRTLVENGLRRGAPWDVELPLRTARGRELWVRLIGVGESRDGHPVRLYGAIQDITERKHTEQALVDSERRLRLVADNLPAQIAHVDAAERFTFVNSGTAAAFGREADDLLGRHLRDSLSASAYARCAPHIAAALAGESVTFEDYDDRPGHERHLRTQFLPDRDIGGTVRGFYAMTLDLTDQHRVERRIGETEERLRGITDNLPAMIAEIDADGRFLFCNETYRQWLGVDPDALRGLRVDDTVSGDAALRAERLRAAYRGEKVVFEEELQLPAGLRFLQTTYVPHFDARHAVAGIYALTHDITELKDVEHRLEALARIDPLTGLANRRAFEERAGNAIARARRADAAMALMYLDIDRFKSINDTLGHGGGDAVLVEFARRIHATVRATDIVARYAGDEFVIALEGIADDAEARDVASKLVAAMRPPFDVDGAQVAVTTSVGVALSNDATGGVADLLLAADRALYEAKSLGRDRVSVARPGRAVARGA